MTTTTHDPLTWVSVNLEFGGLDYDPAEPLLRRFGQIKIKRLQALPELVTFQHASPDIIFFQEGRTYDVNGEELLHYTERVLRRAGVGVYRGCLTRSAHNDLHQVVYINTARLDLAHHWRGLDPNEGTRRYGWVEVIADGDEHRSIMLRSMHLDPRDGDARLAATKFYSGAIRGSQRAMIAGDFNSTLSRRTRRQGEPQRRFLAQTPFHRFGKGHWPPRARWWWTPWRRRKGDTIADSRALDYLVDIGWVDQHTVDHNTTPTIQPGKDRGGELIIDRCFTRQLGTVLGSVQVDTEHPDLTDHRGIAGAVTL